MKSKIGDWLVIKGAGQAGADKRAQHRFGSLQSTIAHGKSD